MLECTSPAMQRSLRNVIRSRSGKLQVQKRIANLDGPFSVTVYSKLLLQLEDRHPPDVITLGGVNIRATKRETTIAEFLRPGDARSWDAATNCALSLDLATRQFTHLAPVPTLRSRTCTAVLDGKIYAIGGRNGTPARVSVVVECLDLQTGLWSAVAPMSTPREFAGSAVLDGKIFVVGGSYGIQAVETGECFDPISGKWTDVAPMNTSRMYHSVISAQGKLFAIGGKDCNLKRLRSVECFDPATGRWTYMPSMRSDRGDLGVAVLDEKLYAIGGCTAENLDGTRTVECLDLTVPGDQWRDVASMANPRWFMGVAVGCGELYVLGGYGAGEGTIECFDPNCDEDGEWKEIGQQNDKGELRFLTGGAICSLPVTPEPRMNLAAR